MSVQSSNWISISFFCIAILTITIFYFTNNRPKRIVLGIVLWGILHSVLALQSFYVVNENATFNPFVYILFPGFFFIFYGAFSKKGKQMYQNRNVYISPIIHSVRIPVEFILYYLSIQELIPKEMTFEGRNFDVLAGISAILLVITFRFLKPNKKIILIFNSCGLIFIFFILANGILASILTYKIFGFSQANIAMMYFPYILLPAVVVPLVIYTHITDIILLTKNNQP